MAMAVANRYARALADVLGPQGDYRRVLSELDEFAAAYGASADLRNLFEAPTVPLADKTRVLAALLERMEAASITMNFLRVLLANHRANLIDQVRQAFRKAAYQRLGVTEVRILLPPKWRRSGQHQIGQSRQRILVGGCGHRAVLPLLGGQEVGSAQKHAAFPVVRSCREREIALRRRIHCGRKGARKALVRDG